MLYEVITSNLGTVSETLSRTLRKLSDDDLIRFLRQFAQQIEELTFKDVPSRLARYLLDLARGRQAAVELPISKSQLASNLGTVSETLSRTLRKLSDDDLIRVTGKRVEVLDVERLEELAERCKEA